MTNEEIRKEAEMLFRANIGWYMVIVGILLFASMLFSNYTVLSLLYSLFVSIAMWNILLYLDESKRMGLQSIEVYGKTICKILVMDLIVFLWSLLLIVPGIIKSFSYAMVPYISLTKPELGIMETLKESETLMKGHRMDYFCIILPYICFTVLFTFALSFAMTLFIMEALAGTHFGPYVLLAFIAMIALMVWFIYMTAKYTVIQYCFVKNHHNS